MFDDFHLVREIGRGSFATVYQATTANNQLVAVKAIKRKLLSRRLQESIQREISIMKQTNHVNITKLYTVTITPDFFNLVLEYCETDLNKYLKKYVLNMEKILNFTTQLKNALKFLYKNKIIHRDIKPSNILIKDEKYLKLADFGSARRLYEQDLASTICGSPLYMAPEVLRMHCLIPGGDNYDAKADLWSIGAVFYEICYNAPPFKARNHIELLKKIDQTSQIDFPAETASSSASKVSTRLTQPIPIQKIKHQTEREDVKDLISKLLKRDPLERISFNDFFGHNVFKQQNATPIESPQSLKFTDSPLSRHLLPPSASPSSDGGSSHRESSPITETQSDYAPFVIKDSVNGEKSSSASNYSIPTAQSVKIPLATPNGVLMIDPPFPGYELDPSIFSDLIDSSKPTISTADDLFLSTVSHQTSDASSDEFVKISKEQIKLPSFLKTSENKIFIPSQADIPPSENVTLNLIALHALSVQTLADEKKAVNLYLAALELYKLGIDVASGAVDECILYLQRKFEYCLQQAEVNCNGSEEQEPPAAKILYDRALALVCLI